MGVVGAEKKWMWRACGVFSDLVVRGCA
jgi:hypothetical protein